MARGKKHTAEQIVNLLRQVEVGVANGKTLPQACKEVEIVEQTYYRWRKEYGGLKVDQARRLKEREQEHAKMKSVLLKMILLLESICSGLPKVDIKCAGAATLDLIPRDVCLLREEYISLL